MKITLIREERESGKEAVSTQETDMLMEKLKTENKTGYITELRSIIPHLKGTNARYEHIDRLPRLYPAVEMTRTKAGEHRAPSRSNSRWIFPMCSRPWDSGAKSL